MHMSAAHLFIQRTWLHYVRLGVMIDSAARELVGLTVGLLPFLPELTLRSFEISSQVQFRMVGQGIIVLRLFGTKVGRRAGYNGAKTTL